MVRECAMREAARHRYDPPPPPVVQPWAPYAATLPPDHRAAVETAEQVAAAHGWDVHTWPHGRFVGIEFRPSFTPTVRIYEWPVRVVTPPGHPTQPPPPEEAIVTGPDERGVR